MSKNKSKKQNNNIFYCVCELMGDTKYLESQIGVKDDTAFAKALANCNVKKPVYFCRIKQPVAITDLISRIKESSADGRYDKIDDYVICPSLKYDKYEFKKYLNMSTIERFQLDIGDKKKNFYIFAKYY